MRLLLLVVGDKLNRKIGRPVERDFARPKKLNVLYYFAGQSRD